MSAPDSVSYDKRVTPVGLLTAICDRHNHKYCMASCSVHVTAPQDSEVLDLTSSQLPSLDGILVPPGLKVYSPDVRSVRLNRDIKSVLKCLIPCRP